MRYRHTKTGNIRHFSDDEIAKFGHARIAANLYVIDEEATKKTDHEKSRRSTKSKSTDKQEQAKADTGAPGRKQGVHAKKQAKTGANASNGPGARGEDTKESSSGEEGKESGAGGNEAGSSKAADSEESHDQEEK